ncbi:MAG: hypothetical protein LUQ47_03910 [Methanotrichaceae archaeon]|nr:hypothetical protein [Methanotrichaceae archaeon]
MDQNENRVAQQGLASRVAISILVLFGGLIVAIIYVAFFAPSFSTFQSIAVIVVVVLAIIAILGMMWVHWGIKQGMVNQESDQKK